MKAPRASAAAPSGDVNARVAAALFDLATVQPNQKSGWGYKGAARAILSLPEPIDRLIDAPISRIRIPNVGPASLRVVRELVAAGRSRIVEDAVKISDRRAEVERSRDLRENFLSRAKTLEVLADPDLTGPRRADYQGDLQMHSVWSDGAQEFADICATGIERGYRFSAITDHFALPIARGLAVADLARQRREIEPLNREYRGRFRLLQGVEVNIGADGEIDLPLAGRKKVDLVVAAPHSVLRSGELQTGRMLAAVRAECVHILGHPRGRKYGVRSGVAADWDAVFDAAAESGIAIELDGDSKRQDLDFELARRALDAGCLFAADSDAHASDGAGQLGKPRSRTPASPAFRRSASSTAGRSSGSSSGARSARRRRLAADSGLHERDDSPVPTGSRQSARCGGTGPRRRAALRRRRRWGSRGAGAVAVSTTSTQRAAG